MKPDISVIMSVYNGETYLKEAIESVINQTFKNWELIVINDCSTDGTAEILAELSSQDPRIKVHPNEVNLRLPTSLNKAISLAQGKYLARMDADDICLPHRLEKQFDFMEKNPDISLSSCKFMTVKNGVYMPGGAGGRCDNDAVRAMLLVGNPILHPGVIAKAEVMRKYNYDPTHTCTEDLELWTRMAMGGERIEILPECLLIYRLHDKQITSTTLEKQHTEVLKVQEKFYGTLLEKMDEKTASFYISGIYFREQPNVSNFFKYAFWLKKVLNNNFNKSAVDYALFEILAEYKRCGVPKQDILKVMLTCNPIFVAKEFLRRKKAAKKDIEKCFEIAHNLGLTQTAGTKEYPIFENR